MSKLLETNVSSNIEEPVEERTLIDYLGDPSNNYDILFNQHKEFESYKDGRDDPSL